MPFPPISSSTAKPGLVIISAVILLLGSVTIVFPLFVSPAKAQSVGKLDALIFEPAWQDLDTGREVFKTSIPRQLLALELQQPNPSSPLPGMSSAEITRNIADYQNNLAQMEASDGPFSESLFQTLIDLGSQFQLLDRHEEALAMFERAEYISRINQGLFHPDQKISTEKMINSYLAMGETGKAMEKQRYLLYINQQYYGKTDTSMLPTLLNIADSNMVNFNQTIQQPNKPMTIFSSTISMPGSFRQARQPTSREAAFSSLYLAQQNYVQAIATLLTNKQYFDPLLLELEYSLLETFFLQSYRRNMIEEPHYYLSEKRRYTGSMIKRDLYRRNSTGFIHGRNAFERIMVYIRHNPQSRIYQLVNALLEYGDWNMLYGRGSAALEKYQEALALTRELGLEEQNIIELFRPVVPVHLPLITAKPNTREKFGIDEEDALDYLGHIDVSFEISRYGKAKNIKVHDKTASASRAIERRLKKFLRNSPFRPRLQEDGSFDTDQVSLRYYFTYAEATAS